MRTRSVLTTAACTLALLAPAPAAHALDDEPADHPVATPPLTAVESTLTDVSVSRDGTVTATGTVQCDQDGWAEVGVQVKQAVGRFIANGYGYQWTSCSTSATEWSVSVTSYTSIRFGAGRATVSGYAAAGNDEGYASQELVPRTVKLRRTRA